MLKKLTLTILTMMLVSNIAYSQQSSNSTRRPSNIEIAHQSSINCFNQCDRKSETMARQQCRNECERWAPW